MTRPGERIFRALLRAYPPEFRAAYGDDLIAFFRQDRNHARYGSGVFRPARFWAATIRDLVRATWSIRASARRSRTPYRRQPGRLFADVRFAWRNLRSTPVATLAAVAVLTLGIGASTSMFSVVDAVALRGVPFEDGSRLAAIAETDLKDARPIAAAPQNYFVWRTEQRSFEAIGASAYGAHVILRGDTPERLRPVRVTASLFDVLRVRPAIGRAFSESDERPNARAVVILSDALWRRRFDARPDVLGTAIALESGPAEIVGVMPASFKWPLGSIAVSSVDFWTPFVAGPRETIRTGGRTYSMTVVGRLRFGVTTAAAGAEMDRIRQRLAAEYPTWFADRGVLVRPLRDAIVGSTVRSWMLFLLGAVGFVLTIACLNVANLLYARAAARGRELAVRSALGATRWDIARALIVESVLLTCIGAVCGVLCALWGVEGLRSALPQQLPRLADISVDGRVLLVTAVVAIITGVVFGSIPALQLARPNLGPLLGRGGRSNTDGASARLRAALVVAEIAVAVVLLTGGGLFLASFVRVLTIDLGLDPRHVASVSVTPPVLNASTLVPATTPADVAAVASAHTIVAAALAETRAVAGVEAAAILTNGLPLSGSGMTVPVEIPATGAKFRDDDEAWIHGVGAGYLDVVRTTMARGRWIAETDSVGAPPVVVLSDDAARRYFGDRDPLGEVVLLDGYPRTVVGVVRGIRIGGPEVAMRPEAYISFFQTAQKSADIVVRTMPPPAAVTPAIQAIVRRLVPGTIAREPESVERYFAEIVGRRKFNTLILSLFATLAIAIAAAGVYGLMAFLVSARTREMAVRVALGAAPAGILGLMLRRAAVLVSGGLAIGLVAAAALEPLARAFLFNPPVHDVSVYAGVVVVLGLTGLAAAAGPARRASRVDPIAALRGE